MADIQSDFYVRHPWCLWTDRHYLNKIIEMANYPIEDGKLQIQIQGAMDDLKSWMITQEDMSYVGWTDINKTPLVIIRAISFSVISMLYARNDLGAGVVVSIKPFETTVISGEDASDYWFTKYVTERNKYLQISGLKYIYVSTELEDPVFHDEGFGFDINRML